MNLLQETTSDWKVPTPNHIYIFGKSSTKVIGYIKAGTTKAVKFSAPRNFDTRHRTFVKLRVKEQAAYDLSALKELT